MGGAEELEVAAAGERVFAAAAVEWELEAVVGGVGAVRIVGCAEGGGIVELHVSEGGSREDDGRESEMHDGSLSG